MGHRVIEKQKYNDYGRTRFRYLSAKDDRLPGNANDQGIVLKIEHRSPDMSRILGSTMVTGDSSFATWKDGILKDCRAQDVSCNILMAAHHGSLDFFQDPGSNNYYRDHVKAMKPAMTIISVGPNSYGHPDETALRLYRENSTGSSDGHKVFRTDRQHTMKLDLKDGGGWSLSCHQ